MKFNTPRCLLLHERLSLSVKGGVLTGGGTPPEDWNTIADSIADSADSHLSLPYAPFSASFADRDALSLVKSISYATRLGEVTAARITLDPILLGTRLDSFIAER